MCHRLAKVAMQDGQGRLLPPAFLLQFKLNISIKRQQRPHDTRFRGVQAQAELRHWRTRAHVRPCLQV